LNAVTFCCRLF